MATYVRWIHKIFNYTDDEIFQNCGMSAIVYLRFLRIGVKLCCVGIFNSFFLIPANLHGCTDGAGKQCELLLDHVEKIALSHVSAGEDNIWATTVAAYVIFGSATYFIFHEFKWFTEYRHKFCTQARPANYTVYVAYIPKKYRSDIRLLQYFRSIFPRDSVLEARVVMNLNNLEQKVAARKKAAEKLEHAINFRALKGYEPTHGNPLGAAILSIPTLATDLELLNREIAEMIEFVHARKNEE